MAINAGKAEVTVVGKYKDEITSKSQRAFADFKKNAQAAFKTALVALTAFAVGMAKAISLANKQELAIAKLEGALRATGIYTKKLSQEMQIMASAFQNVSTTGDEAVLEIQALLFAMGATEKNIKQVTQASLDLSAGMGVDARSAALLFGKALAGDFGTLSRYGIQVANLKTNSEKLAGALSQVQQKFGGQAQAQADTFGGKMTQLSNAFGDFLENIGFLITKNQTFKDMLSDSIVKFGEWGKIIKDNSGWIKLLTTDIINMGQNAFSPVLFFVNSMGQGLRLIAITALAVRASFNKMTGDMDKFDSLMAEATKQLEAFNKQGLGLDVFNDHMEESAEVVIKLEKAVVKVKTAITSLGPSTEKFLQLLKVESNGVMKSLENDSEKLQEFIERQNVFYENKLIDDAQRMENISRHIGTITGEVEASSSQIAEFMTRIGQTTEDAFVRMASGATTAWEGMKEIALSVISDISRAMIRSSIIQPLFGGGSGGGGGILTDAVKNFSFSSLFSGFRADGGPVSGGQSYIVGERGPELFTPGSNGSITANNKMASQPNVTIVQKIEVGTAQTVRAEMMGMMPLFVKQAMNAIAEERQRNPAFSNQMGI
jgi:DNA-binding phage protein